MAGKIVHYFVVKKNMQDSHFIQFSFFQKSVGGLSSDLARFATRQQPISDRQIKGIIADICFVCAKKLRIENCLFVVLGVLERSRNVVCARRYA